MMSWLKNIKQNWHKIYLILAISLVVFAYGVAVGQYQVFPFHVIKSAQDATQDWSVNWKHYLGSRPEKYIRPTRHEGSGVTIYLPEKAYEGVTLITSMWNHVTGMNLIDMDGSVIHEWRVSFNEIWPVAEAQHLTDRMEAPHLGGRIGDWDIDIHGALLYPNGDVVFNFEYGGLVKIDKCSNVLWKLPYITHHSIYEDANGYLWVPGRKRLNEAVDRLPLLEPPIEEEFILKISPDGEIVKEFSILDALYNSGQQVLVIANRGDPDITHVNDIEILEDSISEQYPLFKAGDIMVSIRVSSLIVIIDPISEKVKWSMIGPYMGQHDPDFLANGRISVFDNRPDKAGGRILGGSRILSIDPVVRTVHTLYEGDEQNSFFTGPRGKHQHLPNGNILIAEYDAGRAFEITSSGQIVWSYINSYDEDEVYRIPDATRYPGNYTEFAGGTAQCQ